MSKDMILRVENVSKRFCRSLKRSLMYGLQDIGSEFSLRQHGGGSNLRKSSIDLILRKDEFWALKDVSFELRRGECMGLIGRNGAGKTTLLRLLNGLIKPDTGRIEIRGRVGALIALGAGFNPILSGRENILINASIQGIGARETCKYIDEIIDFSEIGSSIDAPVQTYSSGMQARLGFAAASFMQPDILLVDEVLAVGDRQFQMKCFNRLGQNIKNGSCVILVSHSDHHIVRMTTRCVYLKNGCVRLVERTDKCMEEYKRDDAERLESIGGNLLADQSKPEDKSIFISNIAVADESIGSIKYVVELEIANNELPETLHNIWLEFLIKDLDDRALTYWYQDLQLNKAGKAVLELDFPNIYLNKLNYRVSCAIWDSHRTFIYDSRSEDLTSKNADPCNIADFRLPAFVSVKKI